MLYTVPHYYNKFHCVAGACSDTCCAGWAIMIDDASIKRYHKRKGAFGNRLSNSIDWKKRTFLQYGGRCAFLNEENLCDMYSEAGPGMLCKTCREYPRHTEEYEGVREISLSLSCKEAARLILGCKEPVRFLTKERDQTESYPDFDFFLFTKLMDARDFIFSILQNRNLESRIRIAMVLGFTHDMQRRINQDKLYQIDELFKRYQRGEAYKRIEKKLSIENTESKLRFDRMQEMFHIFEKFEVLKEDWPQYMGELKKSLFGYGIESYEKNRRDFYDYLEENQDKKCHWEQWSEQLMVYFIFTYFSGAVYDGHPYTKVKLAVVSTLFIQEMSQAVFKEKGAKLDFEDFVELSHRYSREVEHSDSNLSTFEKTLRKDKNFGMQEILKLL